MSFKVWRPFSEQNIYNEIGLYNSDKPSTTGQYTGPQLTATLFTPTQYTSHTGSNASWSRDIGYLNTIYATFNETTGDAIQSLETYDFLNNGLCFQFQLPDLSGMSSENSFYIGGYTWYIEIKNNGNVWIWADDSEYRIRAPNLVAGDMYYQYYDGYFISHTFVSNATGQANTIRLPICDDIDQIDYAPESLWAGFDHAVEMSTFVVNVGLIQIRTPTPYSLPSTYSNFDITSTDGNNLELPYQNYINVVCDTDKTITGILNLPAFNPPESFIPFLGRNITIFNNSCHNFTFNHMDGSSCYGNQIYVNVNSNNLTIYPDGFINLVSTYNSCGTVVWKVINYNSNQIIS